MIEAMVDWDAGSYERSAGELEPVAAVVVERAGLLPDDDVLDLACGTGNATLLAAGRGARVTGVDSAPRLLGVARRRARAAGLEIDFRTGDLLELPVPDASADVVLSVFGVVFVNQPRQALLEISRVLRPGGRALLSAWIPAGPIDAMLATVGQIVGRVTVAPPPPRRFAWAQADAVSTLAAEVGLVLTRTTSAELAIRDASPEAYIAGSQDHPMALAVRPVIEGSGAEAQLREAMTGVLRDANEDPAGFLVHSPYVVHELIARNR